MNVIRVWSMGNNAKKWLFYNALNLWRLKGGVIYTYCMMQSPFWEANWFAASQEILRISRNPKVHYRTHKRPPPVPILGPPNSVHIPTSHLLEIRPNIVHPSTPRSPQWSLSLRFPHQDPIHPLSSPIRATCPPHLNGVTYTLCNVYLPMAYACKSSGMLLISLHFYFLWRTAW